MAGMRFGLRTLFVLIAVTACLMGAFTAVVRNGPFVNANDVYALKEGMTTAQVKRHLGEPESIHLNRDGSITWLYWEFGLHDPFVLEFAPDGRLGWISR